MIYKDLLKIGVHFIAVKLFIDFSSKLPERFYNFFYLKSIDIGVHIVLDILMNLFFLIALIKGGEFAINQSQFKENYLRENLTSAKILRISMILCGYFIILNNIISFIFSIIPTFKTTIYTVEIFTSTIISLLMVFSADKIAKIMNLNNNEKVTKK